MGRKSQVGDKAFANKGSSRPEDYPELPPVVDAESSQKVKKEATGDDDVPTRPSLSFRDRWKDFDLDSAGLEARRACGTALLFGDSGFLALSSMPLTPSWSRI